MEAVLYVSAFPDRNLKFPRLIVIITFQAKNIAMVAMISLIKGTRETNPGLDSDNYT